MTDRDLMQQALDALEIAEVDGNCCYEATELLRTRLAQPEQKPYQIDWPEYYEQAMGCGLEDRDEHCRYGAMRYGWDCAIEAVAQALPEALYTTPPQRTWVGLTDEEFEDIELGCRSTPFGKIEAMKRVEAKLKEKNMKLEQLFTAEELALIDSGEYRPGRAVLDAKLDLCAAAEREACAKVCDDASDKALALQSGRHDDLGSVILRHHAVAHQSDAAAIRARGQA